MAKRVNVFYTVYSIIRCFIKVNNWPANELCCQQGGQARAEEQTHCIRPVMILILTSTPERLASWLLYSPR